MEMEKKDLVQTNIWLLVKSHLFLRLSALKKTTFSTYISDDDLDAVLLNNAKAETAAEFQ